MSRLPRRYAPRIIATLGAGLTMLAGALPANGAGSRVLTLIDSFASGHPTTSALVWRLNAPGPVRVAAWRPDTPLAPASTMKIVTSASALLTIGPDFRFTTRVEAAPGASINAGTLRGPAVLIGAGDPMLSTRSYARAHLSGVGTDIARLARAVRASGVRRITGGLVVDETLFDSVRTAPNWKPDYVFECPPLSAIVTNQNHAGTGTSGNVSSPPVAAGRRLAAALGRAGVHVSGGIRAGRDQPGGQVIGQVQSPPLRAIIGVMNPASDNFIAEMLTKDAGAYGVGRGTTPAGTRHAETLLRQRGVLGADDDLVDGSGLSHSNRLSAGTLVRVLAAATQEPEWGDALIQSLEHGGEGTLIHRLRDPTVRKRLRAKTGYINGVASLAGVVTSRSGARYVFAFLINTRDIGQAQRTMDQAVTLLAIGAADTDPGVPT